MKNETNAKYLPWHSRQALLLWFAILATVALILRMACSGPIELTAEALTVLDCMERGDEGCLASRLSDAEVKQGGWNRESIDYAYREIIMPFWNAQAKIGARKTQEFSGQAIAGQRYRLSNGLEMDRVASVYADGQGAHLMISEDLGQAFHAMAAARYGDSAKKTYMTLGWVEGLRRHGPQLQKLGVKGISSANPMKGVYTFKSIEQVIADGERKLSTIPNAGS